MANSSKYNEATVRVYHGYGHTHNLIVFGHVLTRKPKTRHNYTNNVFSNTIYLFRLFLVKPLEGAHVRLHWRDQILDSRTEADGFFKFEWKSDTEVDAGWHAVIIKYLDALGDIVATGEGKIFVPHSTQYAFISDIDDTVLISHSSTIGKRLRVLFGNNPRTRKAFSDVVRYYELLAGSHTTPGIPNPFFYVSSSEWNLYEDLNEFFNHNGLPKGIFLLNQIKRWFQLLKTGKTKHEGKLLRIVRILDAFPKQKFILLGDNSQSDPAIYTTIATKYPDRIFAVYIRNVFETNEPETKELLDSLVKLGVFTCLFNNNYDAIQHSKAIGLIESG
jgi:phosphatidate phosphatase APP1